VVVSPGKMSLNSVSCLWHPLSNFWFEGCIGMGRGGAEGGLFFSWYNCLCGFCSGLQFESCLCCDGEHLGDSVWAWI